MQGHDIVLAPDSPVELAPILEALGARFSVRAETGPPREYVLLDTFDQRLRRRGLSLTGTWEGEEVVLQLVADDQSHQATAGGIDFAWNLPPGPIREALIPALKIRRLLPQAVINSRESVLHVRNDGDETVARVRVEAGTVAEPAEGIQSRPLPDVLRVQALPGHDGDAEDLAAYLEVEHGLARREKWVSDFVLEHLGRTPGQDPSKPSIVLNPEGPARREVAKVLDAYRGVILANEAGTLSDLDSEFLHDFRVSVRRTRSVLGQLRRVFPRDAVERFAAEFSWLGGVTGPTRDLDVFLLKMRGYAEEAAATFGADLAPLVSHLEVRQAREHALLVSALATPRYRTLLRDWQAFLALPQTAHPRRRGRKPAREVVFARLERVHTRLLEEGREILPESPPALLHRLRIRGKKLRYLLDGFRSLFDPDGTIRLIRQLKRLQDCLGDFNDFGVQQAVLGAHVRDLLAADAPGGAPTARAAEQLARLLRTRMNEERDLFAARFASFDTAENQDLVRGLASSSVAPDAEA